MPLGEVGTYMHEEQQVKAKASASSFKTLKQRAKAAKDLEDANNEDVNMSENRP